MDALFVFPFLLLAIVIAFLLADKVGQGILTAAIAITVVYIPLYFRVVRNHTISIREEPFVEAARALGARPLTVIRKYVFFNVVQNVPPLATLNAADDPDARRARVPRVRNPADGRRRVGLRRQPRGVGCSLRNLVDGPFPGLAIVLLVVGLTLLGEGLSETINPVLRKRPKVDVDLGPASEHKADIE